MGEPTNVPFDVLPSATPPDLPDQNRVPYMVHHGGMINQEAPMIHGAAENHEAQEAPIMKVIPANMTAPMNQNASVERTKIDWAKMNVFLGSLKLGSFQLGPSRWVLIYRLDFDFVLNAGNDEREDPCLAQTFLLNAETMVVIQKVFGATLSRLVMDKLKYCHGK